MSSQDNNNNTKSLLKAFGIGAAAFALVGLAVYVIMADKKAQPRQKKSFGKFSDLELAKDKLLHNLKKANTDMEIQEAADAVFAFCGADTRHNLLFVHPDIRDLSVEVLNKCTNAASTASVLQLMGMLGASKEGQDMFAASLRPYEAISNVVEKFTDNPEVMYQYGKTLITLAQQGLGMKNFATARTRDILVDGINRCRPSSSDLSYYGGIRYLPLCLGHLSTESPYPDVGLKTCEMYTVPAVVDALILFLEHTDETQQESLFYAGDALANTIRNSNTLASIDLVEKGITERHEAPADSRYNLCNSDRAAAAITRAISLATKTEAVSWLFAAASDSTLVSNEGKDRFATEEFRKAIVVCLKEHCTTEGSVQLVTASIRNLVVNADETKGNRPDSGPLKMKKILTVNNEVIDAYLAACSKFNNCEIANSLGIFISCITFDGRYAPVFKMVAESKHLLPAILASLKSLNKGLNGPFNEYHTLPIVVHSILYCLQAVMQLSTRPFKYYLSTYTYNNVLKEDEAKVLKEFFINAPEHYVELDVINSVKRMLFNNQEFADLLLGLYHHKVIREQVPTAMYYVPYCFVELANNFSEAQQYFIKNCHFIVDMLQSELSLALKGTTPSFHTMIVCDMIFDFCHREDENVDPAVVEFLVDEKIRDFFVTVAKSSTLVDNDEGVELFLKALKIILTASQKTRSLFLVNARSNKALFETFVDGHCRKLAIGKLKEDAKPNSGTYQGGEISKKLVEEVLEILKKE